MNLRTDLDLILAMTAIGSIDRARNIEVEIMIDTVIRETTEK
jgi:hypothetical protein